MNPPLPDLAAVCALVREVAKREVLPRYMKVAHSRKHDGSLVTEADSATQAALIHGLRALADVPVLGEEMSHAEQQAAWDAGDTGMWCIDPIDGTSNFVAGIAYYAISVAYLSGQQRQLGVIYDPVANECFSAQRGRGAHLNGTPLPLRQPAVRLASAIAGVEPKRLPPALIARLVAEPPYASLRNFGASALDWCYTAAGRFDIYVHGKQKLWDYAAGALILEESGGLFSRLEGPFDAAPPWERSVVAAGSGTLYNAWQDWLHAA
jgi:myo-inositol-1(or 4)-monophosphatase